MCTLTYLLNEDGYELFFNRDEQRSREVAIPPKYDQSRQALYPVDPQGEGTWIAVNKQGLTLALLNNYQATIQVNQVNLNTSSITAKVSRGQLILSLLAGKGSASEQLQTMNLQVYNPFQLCVFPEGLSKYSKRVSSIQWDGKQLTDVNIDATTDLPITSSSVDLIEVSQKRKKRFNAMVDSRKPLAEQLEIFHYSIESNGKNSVNMQRPDAKTVSISHIAVNANLSKNNTLSPFITADSLKINTITFKYFDNVHNQKHIKTLKQER